MSTDWSEVEPSFELLKEMVSIPEVLEMLGYEEVAVGSKIPSPWNPTERTPSCHVYEDHFFDFSTGKGGDVVDLVVALLPEVTPAQALFKLWNKSLRAGREPGDVERQKVRELPNFQDDLWKTPGIGVIEDPYLGLEVDGYGLYRDADHNVLVPHFEPGRIYGVKVRFAAGGKGSWAGSVFTHRLYDPHGWTGNGWSDRAVICEGESDAWALNSVIGQRAEVFALPSGAGSWKDHWLEDLEVYKEIWVCMDNDQAGQRARDKLVRKIGAARTLPLMVPPLYGDAREAVTAGWRPEL